MNRSIPQNFLLLFVLAMAVCARQTPDKGTGKTILLDGHASGRTFDGIGALSAGASSRLLVDYPEPYRSQILDYLFKPDYGASLQHLKVEIGADVNSTDGSEPSHERSRTDRDFHRGYEWWLMQEARRRNPHIVLDVLPWGAPGWVGGGHFYSPDMASYVADFIEGAKKFYGLDVSYAGIWNEKIYDAAYVKQLHRTLLARKLNVKVVCCDEYPGEHEWAVADAMQHDKELASSVAVIGAHYPRRDGKLTTTAEAKYSGKPLWSSEDQPNGGAGPILSRDWTIGGRILAKRYNRNYLEGALTKTEIWSPVTSYYDNLAAPNSGLMYANTPWSGYYQVQGAIWATAHTTQFAQPGWQYLDSSSGFFANGGSYVALKSPDRKNWSLIAETIDAKAPQPITLHISGGLSSTVVHVWETNAQKTFAHVADLQGKQGSVQLTLDPDSLYSLTTTTGQGKGTAEPPSDRPFPFPYRDNFESGALNRAPKFLSDQDGAFEVHLCRQRSGKCLEQVITQKPIPWGPLPNPWTLAGDANWSDYQVSSDVLFLDSNEASLMGRIDSADVFADSKMLWPSGYVLQLKRDGSWQILSAAYKKPVTVLASGIVPDLRQGWHRLQLSFRGNQISARLDGRLLAAKQDSSHAHGMMGIGTGWGTAQFDNLSIAK